MSKSKRYLSELLGKEYFQILDVIRNPEDPKQLQIEFPVDVYPKAISRLIKDCSKYLFINPDFLGTAILTVISTLGSPFRVQLKEGLTQPCSIWASLVAPSGNGKTPAINIATAPLDKMDTQSYRKWKAENERSNNDKSDRRPKQIIVKDATMESLIELLFRNGYLLDIKDELFTWKTNMTRYKNSSSESEFLNLWNGNSHRYNRKSNEEDIRIENTLYNLIGGLQLALLKDFFPKGSQVNGLMSRLLFSIPDFEPIKTPRAEIDPSVLKDYEELIFRYSFLEDNTPENHPMKLTLSEDAKKYFYDWCDTVCDPIANNRDLSQNLTQGTLKMKLYIQRIALSLEILECVTEGLETSTEISLRSIKKAARLVDYYLVNLVKVINQVEASIKAPKTVEHQIKDYVINKFKNTEAFRNAVRDALKAGFRNKDLSNALDIKTTRISNWKD